MSTARSTLQTPGKTCSPWGETSDMNWTDPQLNIVSSSNEISRSLFPGTVVWIVFIFYPYTRFLLALMGTRMEG